ncbi:hypothetical protein [Paraburkholderia bannensis]|uniref:hypothetical protein n=1 Tax=Paraburkholderia bannensis TaxID=765414 RepID=UPI002AB6A480|nr:hypothetical protein [Paraburkholderia bannensis]
MVGLYQPLADGSGYRLVITCPLPDQTCLLQSLQKTKRSVVRQGGQNHTLRKTFFFGFWVPHPASDLQEIEHKNAEPTKHKKAGGVKTASLRTAR